MWMKILSLIFLITIAAMSITGEYENIPPWAAYWPHCCHFRGEICEDLRWFVTLLEVQNRREMGHFIATCGWAYRQSHSLRCCTPAMGWSKGHVIRITSCDALQCKFQHVQYLGSDFGISPISKRFAALWWWFNELSCDMWDTIVNLIFLNTIAAMNIAGGYENIP